MDSITPGAGHEPEDLARRIERIELALVPYQELDVVGELFGRGNTLMRMLAQPMGTIRKPVPHPFLIEPDPKSKTGGWHVNLWGSTIRNGLNGPLLEISGLTGEFATAGDVYVKIDIDVNLVPTNPTLTVGVNGFIEECTIDSDGIQTHANLLIGRVTVEDESFVFWQAIQSAQILTHGFLNGRIVRIFNSAPIDKTFPEEDP